MPSCEPLRTGLIDGLHSPPVAGHPGRQITHQIVSRDYFWPGISVGVTEDRTTITVRYDTALRG